MPDGIEATLWRRMRHTPVRDALRGQITGRLDIARRLQTSTLPASAQGLIARVVRRTRLWRIEKAEVADELIAHFLDGLSEGETVEDLIAKFGNERAAAKLIRRAKRRNRPLAWHAIVFLRRAVFAAILAYGLLAACYFSSRPTPQVDYVAQWNQARVSSTPVDERAWPMYRQAILAMQLEPYDSPEHPWMLHRLGARSGDAGWAELERWLHKHAASLDLARRASEKPSLGFALGVGEAGEDPALSHADSTDAGKEPPADFPLKELRASHLVTLITLAEALVADAHLARHQEDAARFLANIRALNAMAGQLRDQDLLTWNVDFQLRIRSRALDIAIEAVAARDGAPLASPVLTQLAHLFANPDAAHEIVSFAGARLQIADYAQRIYSGSSSTDGRLTPAGARRIPNWRGDGFLPKRVRKWSFYFPDPQIALDRVVTLIGPALSLLVVSRREFTDVADGMMDLAEGNLARPMRDADWDTWHAKRRAWRATALNEMRYAPLLAILPNAESTQASAERLLGARDGLLVAIALELFHREHGRYPDTLTPLVPKLLPNIPVDRITGAPVRYQLIDGIPTVYSVGLDRDDDHGRAATSAGGIPTHRAAASWELPANLYPDGDWILYPPLRSAIGR